MKKYIFLTGIALCATLLATTSCSNDEDPNVQESNELVAVRVHVDDFSVSMDEFPTTRTDPQTPVAYTGVKAVTLAFYSGTTEVYQTTQLKASMPEGKTFGDFELSLPMGSYTMVVLGYGKDVDDALVLTSPTAAEYTGAHTRETLAATQTVNITNTDAVELSATLDRIVAKLDVRSSDGRAANATNVRMTFSKGGKAFNPTTGLATSNTGFANTVGISKAVGETTSSVSYLFLDTDEQNIDVTIETLDADGNTLFSKTVTNVPFKRNRVTKMTGAMYTNSGVTSTFLLNADWLSEENVAF